MLPWWEKWPGRLELEVSELKRIGAICEIEQRAFEAKIVVLNVQYQIDDQMHKLVVVYPDTYPYMRFEIFAPDFELNHHQNPFAKNLCLIGRSTENWQPSDTAASYIQHRLPIVIQTGTDTNAETSKELEELQGEPISDYYTYAPDHMVLIDSSWSIDSAASRGFLTLGSDHSTTKGYNCVVIKVMDKDRNILVQADPEIIRLYPKTIMGSWLRLKKPIVENNAARIIDHICSVSPKIMNQIQAKWSGKYVIGILFPEELAWRETKDSWLFVVLVKRM